MVRNIISGSRCTDIKLKIISYFSQYLKTNNATLIAPYAVILYRANLNFLFSPAISWYNFAQYDNQTETIGWQSRFQWIMRFRAEVYEARVKVKYAPSMRHKTSPSLIF